MLSEFSAPYEVDPKSLRVQAEQQTIWRRRAADEPELFPVQSVPQELIALQLQQVFRELAKGTLYTQLTGVLLSIEGGCRFRKHNT